MISCRFQYTFLVLFAFKCVNGNTYSGIELKPQKVLIPCDTDEDCADLKDSKCDEGFCKCDNDYYTCEETVGILVTKIGQQCKSSSDCNIERSHCDDVTKKCVCGENMIPSHNRRKCLPISTGIGGNCTDSVQCYVITPSTGCLHNKCVCQQDMYEKNESCYQKVDLGGRCVNDIECPKFSRCLKSKCSCDDGFIAKHHRCLSLAKNHWDDCEENIQCTTTLGGGSVCVENKCRCEDLYHYKSKRNKCVRDLFLDETCTDHSDCHQPGPESSRLECFLGVCKCRSIYKEVHGYCISSSSRGFPMIQLIISYIFAMFLM